MKKMFALVILVLLLTACGGNSTFEGGPCADGTTRINMNQAANGSISGGAYPDNCTVFCLWVPEDGSRLDIEISGYSDDLDIYVDQDLDILQYDDFGQWYSREGGSVDESVSITDPGGRYYIQVCSYQGTASSLTIDNNYR